MRDTAGQLPHRFHLVALSQRLFRRDQLRRPLRHLALERFRKLGQLPLRAPPLHRVARALGHFAHKGDIIFRPAARGMIVDEDHRHEPALLGQRHVDERSRVDRFQHRAGIARARIGAGVVHHRRVAALQILDVRAMLTERERPGNRAYAGRVPIPFDRDRLVHRIDQAVAGAAHTQRLPQDFRRDIRDVGALIEIAEQFVQPRQRTALQVRPLDRRDIHRHAGDAKRPIVRIEERLPARRDPVHRAIGPGDAIFLVVLLPLIAVLEYRTGAQAIVGVDRLDPVFVGERLVGISPEQRLALVRSGQRLGCEFKAPRAEPASLQRQRQFTLALLLHPQPVRHLRHERRIVALQPGQALAFQRHVDLAGEEIHQLAVDIENGRHQQPIPERFAILAVIANVRFDRLDIGDRIAQRLPRRGLGFRPLKEAAIAPDDLFARVARQATKGGVGKDHRIVGQPGIGDDHRHARRAHGGNKGVGGAKARQLARNPLVVRDALVGRTVAMGRVRQKRSFESSGCVSLAADCIRQIA